MLSLWSSGNSDIMFGTAFFPLFPSNCAEFFKARESNLPLWSGGRLPIGCWLSGFGMNHSAPLAAHWQITRTRSWELGQQKGKEQKWSQLVKEHEEETLFMENSLTGSLFLCYVLFFNFFFFFSILKEMAPIAAVTHWWKLPGRCVGQFLILFY